MDLNDLELSRLEGNPPQDFRCSRDDQNEFLRERALTNQRDGFSVTHLAYLDGVVVGYLTLAMDAIALQMKEKPRSDIRIVRFPAVKLAQLAVDERWERRGIGKQLVVLSVAIALKLRSHVGCRYLSVDAKPDVTEWYQRQEFKINRIARKEREENARVRGIDVEELPVSLRLDLRSVLVDLRDRYPKDFPKERDS